MPRPNYTIFEDKNHLSEEAAHGIMVQAGLAEAYERPFRIALAGGSTPELLYRLLSSRERRNDYGMNWKNIQVFFGDERCVPPDAPESNYRMVKESLLANLDADNMPQVFRMEGESDPEEGAKRYEETLRKEFGIGVGEIPRFDLILLGMGEDGHTASLFPHKASLKETDRLVIAAEPGLKPFVPRLTLTFPVLNNAVQVLFLVAGEDKATTVKLVFDGESLPDELPSQTVKPLSGTLMWLLDKTAASQLQQNRSGFRL